MAGEEADRRLLRPRCPWSCPGCCMCGDSENPPGLEFEPTALGLSGDVNLQVGGPGAGALGPGDGGGVQLHPLPGCAAWGKSLALPGPQLHLWQREEEACSGLQPAGGLQTRRSCVRQDCQHLGGRVQDAVSPKCKEPLNSWTRRSWENLASSCRPPTLILPGELKLPFGPHCKRPLEEPFRHLLLLTASTNTSLWGSPFFYHT